MKTKTLLLAALLAIPGMTFADASQPIKQTHKSSSDKYYVHVEGGIAMPNKLKYEGMPAAGVVPATSAGKDKSKTSLVLDVGGGYIFNEFFRTDLMIGYRNYRYKTYPSTKINTYSFIANGYLEAHNDTIFTPYLLGGVGVGFSKPSSMTSTLPAMKLSVKGKNVTNFVWNLGAGVRAKVLDSVDVELLYRYVALGHTKITVNTTIVAAPSVSVPVRSMKLKSLGANEILAGVIFRF